MTKPLSITLGAPGDMHVEDARDFYYRGDYVELEAQWASAEVVVIRPSGDTIGHEFPLLVRVDQHGLRQAVTPNGYGGPSSEFFSESNIEAFHELACEQEWTSVFLRCHPIYGRGPAGFSTPVSALVPSGSIAIADLGCRSEEQLLGGYGKGLRRDIRRAQREPIEVKVEDLADSTNEFAAIYSLAMDRLDARPSLRYDKNYLREFASAIGSSGFIVVGRVNDRVTAACCFVVTGKLCNYHLSAADYSQQHAGYAMKLAVHVGMIEAQRRGAEIVNLGGGLGGNNDGLWEFKRRFASRSVDYQTFRMVGNVGRFRRAYDMSPAEALRLPHFPPFLDGNS